MELGFFLSDLPPGCPKGMSSDHHLFLETRKGVPTNRAGTPDGAHLEGWGAFAKPFFSENHRNLRQNRDSDLV
jgi:hypothetical protein